MHATLHDSLFVPKLYSGLLYNHVSDWLEKMSCTTSDAIEILWELCIISSFKCMVHLES